MRAESRQVRIRVERFDEPRREISLGRVPRFTELLLDRSVKTERRSCTSGTRRVTKLERRLLAELTRSTFSALSGSVCRRMSSCDRNRNISGRCFDDVYHRVDPEDSFFQGTSSLLGSPTFFLYASYGLPSNLSRLVSPFLPATS